MEAGARPSRPPASPMEGDAARELSPRVLVVEDEPSLARLVAMLLARRRAVCRTAGSLAEARQRLAAAAYDIVLLDLTLPDGSGTRLLAELSARSAPPVVVVITGQQELETALRVIRQGAFDFIPKPFSLAEFEERIGKAIGEWRCRIEADQHRARLEALVQAMAGRLDEAGRQIERVCDLTVEALGAALDLRYPETEEHCRRVAENSTRLGRALGLDAPTLQALRWGAHLHDIGKIGIPDSILEKSGPLTGEEMERIKMHPELGYRMISRIEFLAGASEVVLYHHEHYDGSGYPRGLKGEEIPLIARIFAVTDALDAMTSGRSYRRPVGMAEFVAELRDQAGRQFDPQIVRRFLELPQDQWVVGSPPTGKEVEQTDRVSKQ